MSNHLEGLNLVELLDLLEPAPEPEPVSWMPQTIGWLWLGLAVAFALFLAIRKFVRYRRATAYRRAGLAALTAAGDDPARIASVIRRTALAGFPREDVAGLTGTGWLEFLDATMPGDGFVHGPGQVLARAPYQTSEAPRGLAELARHWIARHTVPPRGDGARPS